LALAETEIGLNDEQYEESASLDFVRNHLAFEACGVPAHLDRQPAVELRPVDHGVGAAWAMTRMTSSPGLVALVQTALMLPVALVSTPAGALADMFDRRIVGLAALSIALAGSLSLTALTWVGLMTPALLLLFCFIIGSGMALFGPAWQASVSEQVPDEALPAAIALNGISYNIARSFGPAIGGVIVASAGSIAAFATNALL
jgi:MFS family permease